VGVRGGGLYRSWHCHELLLSAWCSFHPDRYIFRRVNVYVVDDQYTTITTWCLLRLDSWCTDRPAFWTMYRLMFINPARICRWPRAQAF
jgi:hypothetical protein